MSEIFLLLNVLFAYVGYKLATEAFNEGKRGWGWLLLISSAWNAAAFLNIVIV